MFRLAWKARMIKPDFYRWEREVGILFPLGRECSRPRRQVCHLLKGGSPFQHLETLRRKDSGSRVGLKTLLEQSEWFDVY